MTRIAVLKKEKCTDKICGYICQKVCPINREGTECISILPGSPKPVIHEELCIGCGICIHKCPVDAIDILNLPEELKQQPVHRYGENGFRVYNMPTPIFGKVVGILGRNGIGKSTVINVLAGTITPNLGDWENKQSHTWESVIQFFKGTEAQGYFEKVRDGKIKVAHKPQNIDYIPKAVTGKVGDLLKKVDETGRREEIMKALDLEKLQENDVASLSGGELQRIAIAATVLRKANVYIFDEPSSFLDIKQRIRVSKFIRGLANEETAVLVVEHDLIILDYMTDLIHLMYGKEGTYGVVSQTKSTRNGINLYLEGYLKEENVRFRPNEIKFLTKVEEKQKNLGILTQWKDIALTQGHFQLEAKEGQIEKEKVVGVVGENGIGKTTFVKILAGVVKPQTGEVSQNLKVSYKPQYLERSDELVMTVLADALKSYDTSLIDPLNIKPLLNKQIDQLSGGELQRVALCLCLSRRADLYLIDEPSAYLDVEQRLLISKVLREFIKNQGNCAIVVDHDLLFIDYISDNLLVFDGVPSKKGEVHGQFSMREGMNRFLADLNITMRRDEGNNRPRINKEGSVMDREQRQENRLYY